ncbi:MAG: hypothetical protein GXO26_05065 [Crenarchaeota archaeon]|nr:hypothetical protein [Thermoproteota archaeon]
MIEIVELIERERTITFKHLSKGSLTIYAVMIPKKIINTITKVTHEEPLTPLKNSRKFIVKINDKVGILLRLCKITREIEIE